MSDVHDIPEALKSMGVVTPEALAKMTQAQRAEIARHMIRPVRCGGTEYIDGKLHLRIGGWLVPAQVLHDSILLSPKSVIAL